MMACVAANKIGANGAKDLKLPESLQSLDLSGKLMLGMKCAYSIEYINTCIYIFLCICECICKCKVIW